VIRVFSMIRNLRLVLAFSAFLFPAFLLTLQAQTPAPGPPAAPAAPAGADYDNRWDFSGGYAFTRMSPGFGRLAPVNLMGGTGQATIWVRPVYGFTLIGRGFTGNATLKPNIYNLSNPSVREYVFLLGPDFRLFHSPKSALGAHWLFGGAYGIFDTDLKGVQPNLVGLYNNQLAFSMSLGATYDYNLSPKLSVRLVTDFQPTYYGASAQEAFAGSLGVVYKMGSLHQSQ
jgi:hypothetical protein